MGYPTRVLSAVAYSPKGDLLAVGYYASGGSELELWDVNNLQQPVTVIPTQYEEVGTIAFSPDGKWLAFGEEHGDGKVRVLDTSNFQAGPIELGGHNATVRSVAFSFDNKTLATVDQDNTLRVWDISNPLSPVKTVQRTDLTNYVAISPDGKTLALSNLLSPEVELWDLPDLKGPPLKLKGILQPQTELAFSPDGHYLAVGASTANLQGNISAPFGPTIQMWDLTDPQADPVLLDSQGGMSINDVAFSPDGRWLANTIVDLDTVYVWDMNNLKAPAKTLSQESAFSLSFSPDGKTLASGGMHDSILLWDFQQPSPVPTVVADPAWVNP